LPRISRNRSKLTTEKTLVTTGPRHHLAAPAAGINKNIETA